MKAGMHGHPTLSIPMGGILLKENIEAYLHHLAQEERSPATRSQYARDIRQFCAFLGEAPPTKERVIQYKKALETAYRPASVNAKLAALNGFFAFLGLPHLQVRQLKIQQSPFCAAERELSRDEYVRLVETAREMGDERFALLLQTICSTGIRVSELPFITVESVKAGAAPIHLKGKHRMVLLPAMLCVALETYLHAVGVTAGPVFVTRSGRPLDRSNIWKKMKALCVRAGVAEEKVFPHNFRHLFAKCFYDADRDIARLADILGHSNINTTRIYIATSGGEHRRQIEALQLVLSR